jgi:hypothetical protein
LEQNQDKIDWYWLSYNPSIFKEGYNYNFLKERTDVIKQELIMNAMHPRRLQRWIDNGGNIDDF